MPLLNQFFFLAFVNEPPTPTADNVASVPAPKLTVHVNAVVKDPIIWIVGADVYLYSLFPITIAVIAPEPLVIAVTIASNPPPPLNIAGQEFI